MPDLLPLRRALISVHDKTGLLELARPLAARGVEILSTGGTARMLRGAGIGVQEVADVTGFPEMMDGRIKTLHPRIHGALLALRDAEGHQRALKDYEIRPIDLLVVNLYPFESTLLRPGVTRGEIVEQIDIGGPAMLRSAAKNHAWVAALIEPSQYPEVLEALEKHDGALPIQLRRRLAAAAFARTAAYDATIARWLGEGEGDRLPLSIGPARRAVTLRYGENPHQEAALYRDPLASPRSLAGTTPLGGKALSYNNYADADAAWAAVQEFSAPACVIVKHMIPCGAAVAESASSAFEAALACDPRSAFGGIVALNRAADASVAAAIAGQDVFFEVLIAPDISAEALETFQAPSSPRWGRALRALAVSPATAPGSALVVRSLDGGLLVQTPDLDLLGPEGLRVVTRRRPTPKEERDLVFAFGLARHVRSNAIVLAQGGRAVGVGAGQTSRVEAAQLAVSRARHWAEASGETLSGAVAASDAFFPFNDALECLLEAGVAAVVQPGGSRNDPAAVELCDARQVAMCLAGHRHFRH